MANVSFNEEPQFKNTTAPKRSVFMKLAYATGIPKNDVQAQKVLLGVVGLSLLIVLFILITASVKPKGPQPTPAELQNMPQVKN
ncbi:MAG: hypothetical protein KA104_01925 [Candidatus Pacebacteria bacterium]|jgi:hypothetical protein|nr:hypothetical protein [Candidatus Paceibacterota bacterium]